MARRVSLTVNTAEDPEPEGQYCLHSRRRKPSLLTPLSASSARSSTRASSKAGTSPSPGAQTLNRRSSKASTASMCSTDSLPPSPSPSATPRSCSRKASVFSRCSDENAGESMMWGADAASSCATPTPAAPRLLTDGRAGTCTALPLFAFKDAVDRQGGAEEAADRPKTMDLPRHSVSLVQGPLAPAEPPLFPPYRRGSNARSSTSGSAASLDAPTGAPEVAWGPGGTPRLHTGLDSTQEFEGGRPEAQAAAEEFESGQKSLDKNVDFMLLRIGAMAPPQDRPKTPVEREPAALGLVVERSRSMNPQFTSTMSRVRTKMMALSLMKGDLAA